MERMRMQHVNYQTQIESREREASRKESGLSVPVGLWRSVKFPNGAHKRKFRRFHSAETPLRIADFAVGLPPRPAVRPHPLAFHLSTLSALRP